MKKVGERQARRQIDLQVRQELELIKQSGVPLFEDSLSQPAVQFQTENNIESEEVINPQDNLTPEDTASNSSSDESAFSISNENIICDIENGLSPKPFKEKLIDWQLRHSISQNAVDDLLKLLQPFDPPLPLCSRTLLQTSRVTQIENIAGGKYCHLGLRQGLLRKLSTAYPDSNEITLKISIDGIPLHKSTNIAFWPILCSVKESLDAKPFAVGVFEGESKPGSIIEFLSALVEELQLCFETGIEVNGRKFELSPEKILFICDAPARAFVKGVKGHMGYYGCEKCCCKGTWDQKMMFLDNNSEPRTDANFKSRWQEEHHHQTFKEALTPLEILGIGMVSQFPLDYMHLVCLGAVRKIVSLWQNGKHKGRLGNSIVKIINAALQSSSNKIPSEFNRIVKNLTKCERWKATEARQFLLYTGPLVLSGNVSDAVYKHFLLLSVAMRIFAATDRSNDDFAKELLQLFTSHFSKLYGNKQSTYNIHNLQHLHVDVQKYGSVDEFSAFPFENYLGELKRLVKGSRLPLRQLENRLKEINSRPLFCDE